MIWRVIFEECSYFAPNWSRVKTLDVSRKNLWKFSKISNVLVYTSSKWLLTQFHGPARSLKPLDGASVHFTEASRNLFFLPDGRALLKLKAEQLKIVNKKKKKKSRKVYYLTELTVYYSSKNWYWKSSSVHWIQETVGGNP